MSSGYLLGGQPSEQERLQLPGTVWEPAGAKLLERIGDSSSRRVLDVGCGAMNWLRILSRWVGSGGKVLGIDIDANLVQAAHALVNDEALGNVRARRRPPSPASSSRGRSTSFTPASNSPHSAASTSNF